MNKLSKLNKILIACLAVVLAAFIAVTVCYIVQPTKPADTVDVGQETIITISEDQTTVTYTCGQKDDGKYLKDLLNTWAVTVDEYGMLTHICGIGLEATEFWCSTTTDPNQSYVVVYNIDGSVGPYEGTDYTKVHAGIQYTWTKESFA